MPPILLLSELFTPTAGGSVVLFENVYSRLPGVAVTVLTTTVNGCKPAQEARGNLRIIRRRLATRRWGALNPRALGHHIWVASQIRALAGQAGGTVHCARGLPEGLAALIARGMGGPRYVCWTHGEELASARSSRELTCLMKCVHRGASALLANSRNTARLLEAWGVAPAQIHVVYPGVETDRFHPGVDGAPTRARFAGRDEVLLLSVGRLQRRKGHDLAISAVAALGESLPHLRYLIVGDGEERERLVSLAADLKVADRVFFAGEVSADALPGYYAACDFLVLPNRVHNGDFEGFGMVFLEAAAAGKAVIGGASGGVPEAVGHGKTGLLVSGTDVGELAEAIRRLAICPLMRRDMGRAGRERALESFTWDHAVKSVVAIQAALGGAR